MDPVELCFRIQTNLASVAAQAAIYTWTDQFKVEEIKRMVDSIKASPNFTPIDPSNLTLENVKTLGFSLWDEDTGLYLIPFWLYPFLTESFEGASISADKTSKIITKHIDTDTRFGCLAYGIIPRI